MLNTGVIAIAASLDKEAQSRTGAGATAIIYRTDDSCGLGENSPEPSASENRRKCGSGLTGQVGRAALVGWSCGRPLTLIQQKQGSQLVLWWGFLLVGAVLKCFKSNCVPLAEGCPGIAKRLALWLGLCCPSHNTEGTGRESEAEFGC